MISDTKRIEHLIAISLDNGVHYNLLVLLCENVTINLKQGSFPCDSKNVLLDEFSVEF